MICGRKQRKHPQQKGLPRGGEKKTKTIFKVMLILNDQLKYHLEHWNHDDTDTVTECACLPIATMPTTTSRTPSCRGTRSDEGNGDGTPNGNSVVTESMDASDKTTSTTSATSSTRLPIETTTTSNTRTSTTMHMKNESIETVTTTRTSTAAPTMTRCNCCCHRTNNDSILSPQGQPSTQSHCTGMPVLVMTFGLGMWCRDGLSWTTASMPSMTKAQGVALLVSLAVLLLLILQYCYFCCCNYRHGDWWMNPMYRFRTTKRSSSTPPRQYSLELTCLLASIGAPPILLLPSQVSHDNKNEDYDDIQGMKGNVATVPTTTTATTLTDAFLQESIDVVICFREFLWTVDRILERFQSATSMKLGLGIWSPAVNRMELNRRQQHNDLWGGNGKRIVARILLSCLAALQHHDEENDNDDHCDVSGCGGDVVVVTLSWLQSTRHQLVEALSDYLGTLDTTAIQKLTVCRATIEQLHTYLCAAMDASFSGGTHEQQRRPDTKALPQSSPLDPVAQHLHAAEIALWAYAQETTTITPLDENDCNVGVESTTTTATDTAAADAAKQEWVERFYTLLKVAQSLHDETCNSMDAAAAARQQQKEAEMSSLSKSSEISSNTSSLSFEDNGISHSNMMEHDRRPPPLPNDATLVFSGRGCVERKRQLKPVASSLTSSGVVSAHVAAANTAMTQAMLIQELRTRLAAMEKRNEIDVTTTCSATAEVLSYDTIEDDAPITVLQEQDGTTFSIPSFLLTELQSSIRIQLQEETMQSFGD